MPNPNPQRPTRWTAAWPPERLAALRELIESGVSPRQVAEQLGVTRCAVIGKCYRESIELPNSRGFVPAEPTRNPFGGKRSCMWPHGDPAHADFRFCGAPIVSLARPYCGFHLGRVYRKAEKFT